MATEPEEANRPRLSWPEHDLVPASRRDSEPPRQQEPEPPAPEPEEPASASVLFTVASRLEGLKTSLASLGARIDSLARSEEQFREFTTARLGEHTQQLSDAMGEVSRELADRAVAQDKSIGELQAGVDAVREMSTELGDHARAQAGSIGELQTGVREGSEASRDTTEALNLLRQRSEEVGQALEVLTGQVQAVAEDLPSLRAELIDFIARTDARDEEMASELSRLVEEVQVLRRRTPVRAATAKPAKRAPRRVQREEPEEVEDDEDFIVEEPAPAPAPRRRSRARRSD